MMQPHSRFIRFFVLPLTILGLSLGVFNILTALAQDNDASIKSGEYNGTSPESGNGSAEGRKPVYIYSPDYPQSGLMNKPARQTDFVKFLNQSLSETRNLTLTNSVEDAQYRVDVLCGGIAYCTQLKVYIKSPHRDVLTAYSLPNIKSTWWLKPAPLSDVAHRLADTLQTHIDQLDQGGYGYQNK